MEATGALLVKKLSEFAVIPARASVHAAGYDLHACGGRAGGGSLFGWRAWFFFFADHVSLCAGRTTPWFPRTTAPLSRQISPLQFRTAATAASVCAGGRVPCLWGGCVFF